MTRKLWVALLAGHLAWTAHLLLSYFGAALACPPLADRVGWIFSPIPLYVATLAAVLVATVGIATGWTATSGPSPERRFVGRLGLTAGAVFLFAIAMAGVMPLVLPPCA